MSNLNVTDAAAVARIRANHDAYRKLVAGGTHGPAISEYCGIFEVNVDELLGIIERLTRPEPAAAAGYVGRHRRG